MIASASSTTGLSRIATGVPLAVRAADRASSFRLRRLEPLARTLARRGGLEAPPAPLLVLRTRPRTGAEGA